MLNRATAMQVGLAERSALNKLLSEVERSLADPARPLWDARARRNLERHLLDTFLVAMRNGRHLGPTAGRDRAAYEEHAASSSVLRRAREVIMERSGSSLEVTDLCHALDISRRGLEVAFQKSIGISPGIFVRVHRLHRVRRALITANPRPGVVKEAALDSGFWHMGHFARQYREHFGEFPSETVHRHAH
jgi:AraC family ethanolamine operon transcriptional activator